MEIKILCYCKPRFPNILLRKVEQDLFKKQVLCFAHFISGLWNKTFIGFDPSYSGIQESYRVRYKLVKLQYGVIVRLLRKNAGERNPYEFYLTSPLLQTFKGCSFSITVSFAKILIYPVVFLLINFHIVIERYNFIFIIKEHSDLLFK